METTNTTTDPVADLVERSTRTRAYATEMLRLIEQATTEAIALQADALELVQEHDGARDSLDELATKRLYTLVNEHGSIKRRDNLATSDAFVDTVTTWQEALACLNGLHMVLSDVLTPERPARWAASLAEAEIRKQSRQQRSRS